MKLLQKITISSMLLLSMVFSQQSAATVIALDPLEDVIVTSDIFDWVWASPCSGGCSQLVDNWEYAGGLYDDALNAALGVSIWRFASVEEFANIPAKSLFSVDDKCAAQYFDNRYSHCDYGNPIERLPNGSFQETLLVRFNNIPLAAQVSEPASLAIMLCGLLGLALRRRT
ncbi:PEP-CTERM sorting domain-containing protein [Agarivorans sp. 1_MG-2023]|uniref:PEP-CTERM sorting domain-containing protein n=1 Tax=Agarivorans sp. 1_MG-2023 TaxID=3062634 RepID=UPI0026E1AA45|nr:PEP-CTERM sorting domain-containing protein [Agarivorans sp. 1_MG-2023]MDO6762589.1 PEP-CTERM sorting domain-containing protein [Agarivorans sp. 1_MG-2023]